MQTTPNNSIKIVRLHSGEDIIADYIEDEESNSVLLDNPMHIIFKRIPSGQTIMMMMPWLPIELIKDNQAVIYSNDILTIIEPKEDLINYYGDVVVEAQQRMEKKLPFYDNGDIIQEEDDDYDDEVDLDDIVEAMSERKKGYLH
jgi:hypothetical protein